MPPVSNTEAQKSRASVTKNESLITLAPEEESEVSAEVGLRPDRADRQGRQGRRQRRHLRRKLFRTQVSFTPSPMSH